MASFWYPVVEYVEKRLRIWKLTFLSRGDRLTVIQGFRKGCKVGISFSFKRGQIDFNPSRLGSLRICLSLFKIHKGVVLKLESLMTRKT